MSRPDRTLDAEGRAWRLVEAWRGEAGHGLCYFLPLEGDVPAADDRLDRRAALGPEERLAELGDERLRELHQAAVPLTGTERRFEDEGGRSWLAQSTGPVWAGQGVAEGLTGLRFTSLSGPLERLDVPDGSPVVLSRDDLRDLLRSLRAPPGPDG